MAMRAANCDRSASCLGVSSTQVLVCLGKKVCIARHHAVGGAISDTDKFSQICGSGGFTASGTSTGLPKNTFPGGTS